MTRAFLGAGFVLLVAFTLVDHAVGQVCVEPPAGLVSWWPADGNADDMAGGNDGVLMGGATFAPGKVGQAFFLNGIDAFVNAGNAPSLHVSGGDFTVEAWVLFNALSHPPGANRDDTPPGDVSIVDKMSTRGINADGWHLLKQADNRAVYGFEDRDAVLAPTAIKFVCNYRVLEPGQMHSNLMSASSL